MAGSKKKVAIKKVAVKPKPKAKAAKARAGEGEVETKQSKRLLQPAGCRSYMRKRLADEFGEIVSGFVEEAKKGSCTHVKLATELLKPTRKGTTRKKGTVRQLAEGWAAREKRDKEE